MTDRIACCRKYLTLSERESYAYLAIGCTLGLLFGGWSLDVVTFAIAVFLLMRSWRETADRS